MVLLRSYETLSKEPPASQTLVALPWHQMRPTQKLPKPPGNSDMDEQGGNVDADAEVGTLLKEWTKTSEEAMKIYQSRNKEESKPQGVPKWVPDE
jgi:hypothetical protein